MENSFPAAVMASLGRQLRALATAPPPGVSWVPGEGLTEVTCDIDGPPGTPYEGGAFRVKLTLGRDYPAAPPKGHFLTKIFHPNVSPVRPWRASARARECARTPRRANAGPRPRRRRASPHCPRPPRCAGWRDLRKHAEARLGARHVAEPRARRHPLPAHRAVSRVVAERRGGACPRARGGGRRAARPQARARHPAAAPPPLRRANFSWSRTTITLARRAS